MEDLASAEIQQEATASIAEENGKVEIQREANTSSINNNRHRELVINIKEMLEGLEPPLSPECCIYRVPDCIRKLNEEAFTPQVVSIGPFHHGNERLRTMEKFKMRCLERFMKRSNMNVENLVDTIKNLEGRVRDCYAETIHLSSDDFAKLILVDASFVVEFFVSQMSGQWTREDKILLKPWLDDSIRADMRLLENQLPFFVIEKLFDLAFASRTNVPSFTRITFDYFAHYNTQGLSPDSDLEIKHFVDLIRILFFLPSSRSLLRRERGIVKRLYTASQLNEAGVKFKVIKGKGLVDLQFTNGELEIPFLELDNPMERNLRNVTAWEQCHYPYDAYVCDYIVLLDFLISTTKDADLLIEKGILVNWIGNSNAVTTFINNLCPVMLLPNMNSNYCRMCKDLNAFYEKPWHSWKATLRLDYFSTPWRAASTIAAVTFLVLTLIQTICSIIQLV